MTVLGSLLAMLRDLAQLAASPSGLTAMAAAVLAGAMFAAVLLFLGALWWAWVKPRFRGPSVDLSHFEQSGG